MYLKILWKYRFFGMTRRIRTESENESNSNLRLLPCYYIYTICILSVRIRFASSKILYFHSIDLFNSFKNNINLEISKFCISGISSHLHSRRPNASLTKMTRIEKALATTGSIHLIK